MSIIELDLQHIWHPCSQMKDYATFPPLPIQSANGSYLFLEEGGTLIDAISSWWCKSLGHAHPRLKQALLRQLDKFEHVILANTTHTTIVELSQALAQLTRNLNKIFYASDGSSAVEIAMKMSLHAHQLQGEPQRQRFLSLQNGYHGETAATLSVSDLGLYSKPYAALLFESPRLNGIPYVNNQDDPLWHDCAAIWPTIEKQLRPYRFKATALILEPIVQGAGGMLIYSQDFLRRLRLWTAENNIYLIADEIMTGLGRTGLPLACQHANIEPDFLCLSKGLTSGWLPLSVVCTSTPLYNLFYDDYEKGKSFLHSHTFSGNALAASVALECLKTMKDENIFLRAQALENKMRILMNEISEHTQKLKNIRSIGAVIAADLVLEKPMSRAGYQVFKKAVELGALLRPLGDTIYWLPPLNIEDHTLLELQKITELAIKQVLD